MTMGGDTTTGHGGRESTSRQLDAALDAVARPGSHPGLLVVGPRGMGKSTLLDDLEAALDGIIVRLRGLRNVPTVPYGAAVIAEAQVSSALGIPVVARPDDVGSVRQALADAHVAPPSRADALDSRMLDAFVQSMRLAAGRGRIYLLVDDVDHVDAASRALFALAAAYSTAGGGVVCSATREEDVPELHDFRRLELKPLTVDDVVETARSLRSLTPPATVAQRVRDLTDGRPAVVQELVEQLTETQLLGTSLIPTTERLADAARAAVADLVAELPPPTLEALHLVVTSGTRSAGLVSRMLDTLGSCLEDLVDDGAVVSRAGYVRPVSGLLERHLRATTTSTIRRRAARALLAACADDLDPVQEAFSTAVATSDAPGESAGLVLSLAAHAVRVVQTSSSRDAGDRARRLLAAAWPHSTPEVRGLLSAAEAQVALHDGLLADALAVAQNALDGFSGGRGRVALARVVQNVRLLADETVSASIALDALDQAHPSERSAAQAFAVETALMLLAVGRPTAAQTVAERVAPLRDELSDALRAELDYALARTGSSGETDLDATLERWSQARARGEVQGAPRAGRTPWECAGMHLYALRHAGKIAEARAELATLSGTPRSRYDRLLYDLNHAMVEFARGSYVLAVHHLEKMSEISDLSSCATSLRVAVGIGSSFDVPRRGTPSTFLHVSRGGRAIALGPTLLDVRAEITQGVYCLASGQGDRAVDLFEHARSALFLDDDERTALADTMITVVLPTALARAYVAEGRPDDARSLSTTCSQRQDRCTWMSVAAQELVDAVLATPGHSPVPETDAVRRWFADPRLVRPVRDHLRQVFAAPSVEQPASLGPAEGAVGGRPDSSTVPAEVRSVLSDRELQIALLVARGMRNKEISASVYLSVRTVEATLTRVFRKVDVRSRTELVSRLGGSTAVLSGDVAR